MKKTLKFLLDKNSLMFLGIFIMTSNYFVGVNFNRYIWVLTLISSTFLIALNVFMNYDNKYKVTYNVLVKLLLLLIIGKVLTNIIPDTIQVTQHYGADLKSWIGLIFIIISFVRLGKNLAD